ncbi:MAG TPA: YaeQ family protein [Polyangiaceae bacterium]|nr:YaeQ family protein [Polyangiaceae bacterium]
MALTSTLYRLHLELSDVDRGVYQDLDLRIAQHPSEALDRVVARALAYAICLEDGIDFGKGLSDTEEPALWTHDLTGRLLHWIEVGLPSAERLHLASKRAERVSVVCHKDLEMLMKELGRKKVHRAEHLRIFGLKPEFVAELAKTFERTTSWMVLLNDGELSVTVGARTFTTTVARPTLSS